MHDCLFNILNISPHRHGNHIPHGLYPTRQQLCNDHIAIHPHNKNLLIWSIIPHHKNYDFPKKIEIIWDSIVEDVVGEKDPKSVKAIKIKNIKTNKVTELKVDGVFIAIGHDPATSLFIDKLKMDDENYIITKPDSTETSIKGVFAAGDVKDKVYRQAVTAAGMGCMAALEAEKYIAES